MGSPSLLTGGAADAAQRGLLMRQGTIDATIIAAPPYSLDFNPIEMLFAKLKTLLRKAAGRTIASLWATIGRLLDEFSADECSRYLAHAGYGSI